MSRPNTGESSHRPEEWAIVRPLFHGLYNVQGYTLHQTMKVLELCYGFQASDNSFKKRIGKNWPECRKNNTKNNTATDGQTNRKRPKKIKGNYPEIPHYVNFITTDSIPQSLSNTQYQAHELLLLSIDKYTKGFFDSKLGQQQTEEILSRRGSYENMDPNLNAWRCLLSQCQQISTLVRRKKDFAQSRSEKPMGALIMDLLDDNVFKSLREIAGGCRPSVLPFFWGICGILEGLSPQLGSPESLQPHPMRCFVERLFDSFSKIDRGHNIEMRLALQKLLDIPLPELRDVSRISCLCSARALSNKLGPDDPIVLETWADYYQHWDKSKLEKSEFLSSYRKAYMKAKSKFEPSENEYSERTLVVLLSYSYVAHYICHDNALSLELAEDLWKRTGDTFDKHRTPQCWTVKIQGMVEAARIQALLRHASHENKHKSRQDLRKQRRSLNLWSKRGRRRHRKEVLEAHMKHIEQINDLPPYDVQGQIECGIQTILQKLRSSQDQECQFLATELYALMNSMLLTSHKVMPYLRTSVDSLSTSDDQNCQLLAAALCDLLVSLIFGIVQDIVAIQNSVTLLLSRGNPGGQLLLAELSGLCKFLKKEIDVRRNEGESSRTMARELRVNVVMWNQCIQL